MRRAELWSLLLACACSTSTSGGLVQVPFAIGGAPSADGGSLQFTTAQGWQVTLEAAKIDLGPFYFNIDAPDPGEYRDGQVIVEAIRQVTVDLLDPDLVPVAGGAQGEIGIAPYVEIELLPPDQTISDSDVGGPEETSTAFLNGVAVGPPDSGEVVPFQGWITIDQSLASETAPLPWIQRVDGALCKPSLAFDGGSQSLTLRVDPRTWFDTADFRELLPTPAQPGGASGGHAPDGGPYGWTNASNFHSAVLGQIKQTTGVYDFTLSGGD